MESHHNGPQLCMRHDDDDPDDGISISCGLCLVPGCDTMRDEQKNNYNN